MDLIDLRVAYEESGEFSHLAVQHIKYVPGRGSKSPVAMLIGEAPGASENLHGKPFVGRSGRVLDQLMQIARLRADDVVDVPIDVDSGEPEVGERANVYVTNTVKYRPPGNRTPTA